MEHHHTHTHTHTHNYKETAFHRLLLSLSITLIVMFVEVVGGWMSGSIALIGDAGHMLTHAFAISISLFGIKIAREPRCHHRTFGLLRAEVLAAFVNGLFLMLVSVWIVVESVERLIHPVDIFTQSMFIVAVLGLIVNVVSVVLLEGVRHGDLNVRSVFMHMIGDAVSSIAIVVSAVVIRFSNWFWIDPLLGIVIAIWIAVWAIGLLKDSARILLEMAPKGMNSHDVSSAMKERFPVIEETGRERLWTITENVVIFSAWIRLRDGGRSLTEIRSIFSEIERWLEDEFGISESTLQID